MYGGSLCIDVVCVLTWFIEVRGLAKVSHVVIWSM